MGIGVTVGILADMLKLRAQGEEDAYDDRVEDFRTINQILARRGLPLHNEPENIEVWSRDLFSAFGLQELRRVAAHIDRTGRLPPPNDNDRGGDEILDEYYETAEEKPGKFDHLIMHSDCDGYYIPIDFPHVLYCSEEPDFPYESLGSSQRLLAECRRVADELQIPSGLTGIDIHKLGLDSASESTTGWKRYYAESYVCVSLIEASEQSIRAGAAIWCD